eukprot:6588212-Karenia_brevis.AAC.1
MALACLREVELCPDRAMEDQEGLSLRSGDAHLVPPALNYSWTEHSERPVLNGWAAMLGFNKDERDKLGRWQASQSDDYLRAARAT